MPNRSWQRLGWLLRIETRSHSWRIDSNFDCVQTQEQSVMCGDHRSNALFTRLRFMIIVDDMKVFVTAVHLIS